MYITYTSGAPELVAVAGLLHFDASYAYMATALTIIQALAATVTPHMLIIFELHLHDSAPDGSLTIPTPHDGLPQVRSADSRESNAIECI